MTPLIRVQTSEAQGRLQPDELRTDENAPLSIVAIAGTHRDNPYWDEIVAEIYNARDADVPYRL